MLNIQRFNSYIITYLPILAPFGAAGRDFYLFLNKYVPIFLRGKYPIMFI